jgi:hypothetical protein
MRRFFQIYNWYCICVCSSILHSKFSRVKSTLLPLENLVWVQAWPPPPGDPWGDAQLLGVGLAGRDVPVQSRTIDSCGAPGAMHADTVARCTVFPWHIGVTGFRVKRALYQEPVRLGWVVFRRMNGSRPSPLQSPHGSCRNGTGL